VVVSLAATPCKAAEAKSDVGRRVAVHAEQLAHDGLGPFHTKSTTAKLAK
jgi:hypothetical protein